MSRDQLPKSRGLVVLEMQLHDRLSKPLFVLPRRNELLLRVNPPVMPVVHHDAPEQEQAEDTCETTPGASEGDRHPEHNTGDGRRRATETNASPQLHDWARSCEEDLGVLGANGNTVRGADRGQPCELECPTNTVGIVAVPAGTGNVDKPIAVTTLDAAALASSLRRMKKLGSAPGPGTWSIDGQGLKVSWMGMSEVFDGVAQGRAVAVVSGDIMRGLARASATWSGELAIKLYRDELKIGSMIVEAELRDAPPPQLLPLNAEPQDLVRLHVHESVENIADAGLDAAVAEALVRLDKSCAAAARSLDWLGVSDEELRAWVLARYAPPEEPRRGHRRAVWSSPPVRRRVAVSLPQIYARQPTGGQRWRYRPTTR